MNSRDQFPVHQTRKQQVAGGAEFFVQLIQFIGLLMKWFYRIQEPTKDSRWWNQQRPAVCEVSIQPRHGHIGTYEMHVLEGIVEP